MIFEIPLAASYSLTLRQTRNSYYPPLVAQVEIWSVVKVKVAVEGLRDLLLSNGGQQQQFSLARHPRKLST